MVKVTSQKDISTSDIAATSEISRLLAQDTTPWYKKNNLRSLYFFLVPSALGVEVTTGRDPLRVLSASPILILSRHRIRWKCSQRPPGRRRMAKPLWSSR
jgi:hypothetical protein